MSTICFLSCLSLLEAHWVHLGNIHRNAEGREKWFTPQTSKGKKCCIFFLFDLFSYAHLKGFERQGGKVRKCQRLLFFPMETQAMKGSCVRRDSWGLVRKLQEHKSLVNSVSSQHRMCFCVPPRWGDREWAYQLLLFICLYGKTFFVMSFSWYI